MTPFNRLLGERVRRLIGEQKQSQESVALKAGIASSTLTRLLDGSNVSFGIVMSVLYELDAGPSDLNAIFADFAEHQREGAYG